MSSYTELIKNNSEGIFIISKNDCSLCEKLKGLFDTIEVEYKTYLYEQENEIDDTLPFKEQMKQQTNGTKFPFCYFNGKYHPIFNCSQKHNYQRKTQIVKIRRP